MSRAMRRNLGFKISINSFGPVPQLPTVLLCFSSLVYLSVCSCLQVWPLFSTLVHSVLSALLSLPLNLLSYLLSSSLWCKASYLYSTFQQQSDSKCFTKTTLCYCMSHIRSQKKNYKVIRCSF